MRHRHFSLSIIILSLCAGAGSLWAQDASTTDIRNVTHEKSSANPALSGNLSEETTAYRATTRRIPAARKKPVILNFDRLPGKPWITYSCNDFADSDTSHGILTINSPADCFEFILDYPRGTWHKFVDNKRGWIIEASLRVDPATEPLCDDRGSVQIWANDHTNLVIIGFSPYEICIAYPDNVRFPMNTTDSFHIYRIESKGNRVKVYVDGDLKINHTLSWTGGGSNILMFGDGVTGATSLTDWDYFSYDIFPRR